MFRTKFAFFMAFSVAPVAAYAQDVNQLLQQEQRPTIAQISQLNTAAAATVLHGGLAPTPAELAVFKVYDQIIKELLRRDDSARIFIFARDGEGLFDAIQTSAPAEFAARTHLLNLSRPISKLDSKTVLKFLRKQTMPIDDLIKGKAKMVWIDTGSRGNIYINLFRHIMSLIKESRDSYSAKVKMVLESIDARLITARASERADEFRLKLEAGLALDAASLPSLMSAHLYFPEIPSFERANLGIPIADHEKWKWITNSIEYTPKWQGRATGLDGSLNPVITVEPREASRINKSEYLRLQIKIYQHFSRLRENYKNIYKQSQANCHKALAADAVARRRAG